MEFGKKWFYLAGVISMSWLAPAAAAEDGQAYPWLFSMSFTMGTYELASGVDNSASSFNVGLGRMFNDYIGFEGRIGLGFNDDNASNCRYENGQPICAKVHLRVKDFVGAYARGYFTSPGRFRPYALLGYGSANTAVALDTITTRAEEQTISDVSYGLGLEIGGGRRKFTIEYLSLFDADGHSMDGFSAGFLARF